VIIVWQLVGEALRANFCELLRLFQLKRTRGLTLGSELPINAGYLVCA
jgi:hypothetical protein